jgi:small subunit ribosomal protein S7
MRKSKPKKRILLPDPKFNDRLVTQFVNNMMLQGKKNTAFNIFYDALDIVEKRNKEEGVTALEIWKKAMLNVTPSVEVKSRRIGGATFQVPNEVRGDKKVTYAMKFIILFARKRTGKPMAERLAEEILAAYKEEGGAFKKKEDMHKMAEANKAFSHFRF